MSLIFDSHPLVVNPDLAVEIGLHEAIILQQIHYWVSKKDAGIERDGCRWIYNTHEQWQKQFPFLSQATIKRCLNKLRKLDLISVQQFNKNKHDWTNFYSVNYDQIHQLNMSRPNGSICTHPEGQIDPVFTETTTEITAENKNHLVDSGEIDSEASAIQSKKTKLPACPIDTIINLWSEIMPDKKQPLVSIWKQGQNGVNLSNRWKQCFAIQHSREDRKLYHDLESGIEFWRLLFQHLRKSEFLMADDRNFFGLDWIVKKVNFEKILEGKYHA